MATLILSSIGSSVGAGIGGVVLGIPMAEIGQVVFAGVGRAIDYRLLGGLADPVETGRIDKFQIGSAQEGTPIVRLFGRMRTPGHLLWSTNFLETQTTSEIGGGGKGGPRNSSTRQSVKYSYSVSVAFALCEGVIQRVDRIWADGQEIAASELNMRVYNGSETQTPDAKIEAVQGAEDAPAYRGVAYVVIEALQLEAYGNRIPRMEFEVVRQAQPAGDQGNQNTLSATRAVALIPGSGEYVLAVDIVYGTKSLAQTSAINEHTHARKSDFQVAIQALGEELENCKSVSLVVSWFGDDLRADKCTIRPKVEHSGVDADTMPWRVSGLTRSNAQVLSTNEGRPIYGGTPTDQSVIQGIKHLKEKGFSVVYYPFILMDIMSGNKLPDPWSDANSQPVLPWRGHITTSKAPGQSGSKDKTAGAGDEVAAFFGTCLPEHFNTSAGDTVDYSGPEEWSYRRFILHAAKLCALAGGVEGFCIGSEMRGLTRIRSDRSSFPVVDGLRRLAGDVREILGVETKITYAADWTEYFGYHPDDGSKDVFFYLDPLWADANIDCIGIDNYMPLSDWRDGEEHKDAKWGEIYNLAYLKANIEGGEGYEWYYASAEDRGAQNRTPITDGDYNELWVFRYKDIRGWWSNPHYNRINGIKEKVPTQWVAKSKPIWFTEIGCAALDKATNQPNKFLDPLSAESSLPYYSLGTQDQLIQKNYFAALYSYWNDAAKNPQSDRYTGQMIDMAHAYVWNWDARPYPAFPNLLTVWSDGEKYALGHWITGRTAQQSLAQVVREICAKSGLYNLDTSTLYGQVHGYRVSAVETARASLQPLMLAYGFDVFERGGVLTFKSRGVGTGRIIGRSTLALARDGSGPARMVRAPQAETAGRVRLRYLDADRNYETRVAETVLSDDPSVALSQSEFDLTLDAGEAEDITKRWLVEARIARDSITLTAPLSQIDLSVGDVICIDLKEEKGCYRITGTTIMDRLEITAQRIEQGAYNLPSSAGQVQDIQNAQPPTPGLVLFLDLPLIKGDEAAYQPYLAVTKAKWGGAMSCYYSSDNSDFTNIALATAPAKIGKTLKQINAALSGVIDRGTKIRVELASGVLSSVSLDKMLNGANFAAIGSGSDGPWEVIQFKDAKLVAANTYEISGILRGQVGTDGIMPSSWPVGSYFVLIDAALTHIDLPAAERGLTRNYRTGPSVLSYDNSAYRSEIRRFDGIGLRPFSPCHLGAVKIAQHDIEFTWIRRTRIDGDSWQSYEVSLGEERELYLVSVYSGSKKVRQVEISETKFTYSEAEQASDGVTTGVEFRVAQISDKFGPGPERGVIFNG